LERVVHNDDDGRWLYGAGGGVGARRITRSRLGKTTAKASTSSCAETELRRAEIRPRQFVMLHKILMDHISCTFMSRLHLKVPRGVQGQNNRETNQVQRTM
ncbi:hypothetical protein NPIL_693591, partial [Nephila pilipes]